jgi:hypothetical protein
MTDFNLKIEALCAELKEVATKVHNDSYNQGYNDALGVVLPTQQEFDKDHTTPLAYGDESEWLVLSRSLYTEEEAIKLFKTYLTKEFGWDDEDMAGCLQSISQRPIGYARLNDENGSSYCIGKATSTFWDAWVVETE